MNEVEVTRETEVGEGRYVYCIVNSADELNLGNIGMDKAYVYTVSHKDIGAVVHACQAQPYESKDEGKVKEWIFSHNNVIDKATEHFGTVLPFSFDAIVKGNDDTIEEWLSKGYKKLKQELERLRNKAEYTVQIFCDQEELVDKIVSENQDVKELKEKTVKMPKRGAYLLHRKFELKVKEAYNAMRVRLIGGFASKIKEHVEEMKVEEKVSHVPENYRDKELIVAFSCLVHKDKVKGLGEVLAEIDGQKGYAVRFTGPWAPFSSVKLEEI